MVDYEHVSHWETKAATFEEYSSAGKTKLRAATDQAMNHPYYQQQQSYKRKDAFELMQSIKYFGSKADTKKLYAKRVAFWKGVKKASATGAAALNQYFKKAIENAPTISERSFILAASYDARDMAETGAIESLVSEATIASLRKSTQADRDTIDYPYDRAAELLSKGSIYKFFELLKEGGQITQESKRALYDMIKSQKIGPKNSTKILSIILKDYPEFIHPLVEAASEPSTAFHSKILVSATEIALKNNDTALAGNIAEAVFNSQSLKESLVESTVDKILDHIFKKKNLSTDWREVIDVIIATDLTDKDSSVFTATAEKISTWVSKQAKPDVLQASKLVAILSNVNGAEELELRQIANLISASKKLKGKAATHYLESLAESSRKNQPGLFSMTEIMLSASAMTNTAERNKFITEEIGIQIKGKFETPVSRPIYEGSVGDIAITLPDTGALVIESTAKIDRHGRELVVLKDKNGFSYSLYFENTNTGKFIKNDLATYDSLEKAGVSVTRPIHSGSNFYIVDTDIAETDLVRFLRQDFENFNVSDTEKVNDLRVFFERLLKSGIKLDSLHPSDIIWNGEEWSIITTASVPKKIKSIDKLSDIYSSLVDAKWRPELVMGSYVNGQYQQRSIGCNYLVNFCREAFRYLLALLSAPRLLRSRPPA